MQLNQILEKADYIHENLKSVTVKPTALDLFSSVVSTANHGDFVAGPSARDQLLELLHIKTPITSLITRFGFSEPLDLMNKIVRFGIEHKKKPIQFIYDINNQLVHGTVSTRYKRISCKKTLEYTMRAYGEEIDERFSFINFNRMKIFFNSDEERITPIMNEKLRYGINLGNSETGNASLSLGPVLTFIRCLNGLTWGKLEDITRIVHLGKSVQEKFTMALFLHKENNKILDTIDEWAQKPPIFSYEDIMNEPATATKLDKLLTRFGVNKKEYRKVISEGIIPEYADEDREINTYWIGNAVNDYASNYIDDPIVSQNLISVAYNIMSIQ